MNYRGSAAQKEIQRINGLLNDALAKVEQKYADQIKNIQTRITDRVMANNKTVDIESESKNLKDLLTVNNLLLIRYENKSLNTKKNNPKLEAEVGPTQIHSRIYLRGSADQNLLEVPVRWVIYCYYLVFDPCGTTAYCFQYTFHGQEAKKAVVCRIDPDPEDSNDRRIPYTEEEWNEAHRLNLRV